MAKKKGEGSARREEKDAALKRIGERRVRKALKAIRLIGNMARYTPSAAQQKTIMVALQNAVDAVGNRFAGEREYVEEFTLS